MTEFELLVREAIFAILEPKDGDDCASWVSDKLAPRVAAAIESALEEYAYSGIPDESRDVALTALRGGA